MCSGFFIILADRVAPRGFFFSSMPDISGFGLVNGLIRYAAFSGFGSVSGLILFAVLNEFNYLVW